MPTHTNWTAAQINSLLANDSKTFGDSLMLYVATGATYKIHHEFLATRQKDSKVTSESLRIAYQNATGKGKQSGYDYANVCDKIVTVMVKNFGRPDATTTSKTWTRFLDAPTATDAAKVIFDLLKAKKGFDCKDMTALKVKLGINKAKPTQAELDSAKAIADKAIADKAIADAESARLAAVEASLKAESDKLIQKEKAFNKAESDTESDMMKARPDTESITLSESDTVTESPLDRIRDILATCDPEAVRDILATLVSEYQTVVAESVAA